MIIDSSILTAGKKCKSPIKYTPDRDAFEKYAHYYERDPQELFDIVNEKSNVPDEYEEMCSEEEEDNEIKETDRLAFALVSEENDVRLDTYILDKDTEAFYVHHDDFLHGIPTGLAVSDRDDQPIVFISNEDGSIAGYRSFVTNHFLPDMVILAHDSKVESVVADGKSVASYDEKTVKVWDIDTEKLSFEIKEPTTALTISGDNLYTVDKTEIYLIDMREGKKNRIFTTQSAITAISTEGNTIAVGLNDGSVVYSINREKEICCKPHTDRINSLTASLDRYIVTASKDESIMLFDMQNREIVERKQTNIETATVRIPRDTPSIYVYPTEEGELGIGSFEEAILRIE